MNAHRTFTYYADSKAVTWGRDTIMSEVPTWAGPSIVAALNHHAELLEVALVDSILDEVKQRETP